MSSRHAIVGDWTAAGRASVSAPTRAVLESLDGPVEIVSYASAQGTLRQTVAAVIARYSAIKRDLTLRFVDPTLDPAAMRQLGVSVNGALIVHYQGREQHLDELSERSLTNALERLARGTERIVAFVTGDGERQADGKVSAVPQHTDLVVLASPVAPLAPGAVHALVDYLDAGGNLLWLTEPANDDLGLRPLATALGVQVLPGVLVDGGGSALGLKDPRMLATGEYPAHPVTAGLRMTTLFPQAAALAQVSHSAWAVVPFLRSGPQSWTEFQPIANDGNSTIRYDADAGELKGPLDFGFALSRLSPSPDKSVQRAIVVGDGDFLSNTFLGNGGNRALGERLFDWLLGDDKLVDLPPRGAPDRVLAITQGQLNALSFGFLLGLPLLLLATGGVVAWRRRRR